MNFSWHDFLNLAKSLSERKDEASDRSAISRAYYAAFCTARDSLLTNNCPLSKGSEVHGQVQDVLGKAKDFDCQKIAQDLGRLRLDRNKADYDIDFPDLDDARNKALFRAAKIIERIENIPKPIFDELKNQGK